MITSLDVAWLAGIVEGEGSIMWAKATPVIALQMTDDDVVRRAAKLLGVDVRKPWRRAEHHKLVYGCRAYGRRAIGWMMTLYAFMGERRRAKIRECLAKWKDQPNTTHASRGQRTMAICHPDRVVLGRHLCRACYMRDWRERQRR